MHLIHLSLENLLLPHEINNLESIFMIIALDIATNAGHNTVPKMPLNLITHSLTHWI